jgi:8-oxo-dGTP diphosphatase
VAGGWELPGGKCEPAEDLATAAVRELHEELGCEVAVTGHLSARTLIRPGWTLEVVTAEVVTGTPVPREHDAVRWLAADELFEVRWLPADVPFLTELAALLQGPGEENAR